MGNPDENAFYLGRIFDLEKGALTTDRVLFNSDDLTTHGIITGMTGSGKTGLGVIFLEEAARKNIPAIVIDLKGDLTNLLLHFPGLLPQDFEPWLDPDLARREGKPIAEVAAGVASTWQKGLASWELGPKEITELQNSVQFNVFTPGSTVGTPVNILSSFAAPPINWEENAENLRERISATVTGLLNLVGMQEIDPLRSREHILLSNLIEYAWSKGTPLDLNELIMQVQTPPFERLGAFPIDRFFPEKDRFDLAMLLNNFLAAPSFQTWLKGQNLDIQSLLYTSDGRPCHNVFYLAHLNDNERMFFVTLLLASVESWMRTQRGTGSLRALVYFDEIMGYLPPVQNPPSRILLLRMLKQARAFGVGVLLATQNPVDVDYKALSNAGVWMIGRLQTEQDKERLLDGLMSATGGLERKTIDKMISGLQKRTFLFHNVHQSGPKVFQTRWTLNYLAGPLMRNQIPALVRLSNPSAATAIPTTPAREFSAPPSAQQSAPQPAAKSSAAYEKITFSSTRPSVPAGVQEYFIPVELDSLEATKNMRLADPQATPTILYRPALLAQAQVRYLSRAFNINYARQVSCLVQVHSGSLVPWEEMTWKVYPGGGLQSQPVNNARFDTLPEWLSSVANVKSVQKDFLDWLYRGGTIQLKANEELKVYAAPDVTTAQFRELCSAAARSAVEKEVQKTQTGFEQKIAALQNKIQRQEMDVKAEQKEFDQRKLEEMGAAGEMLLSLISKRKKSINTSLTKRRLTAQSKMELEQEQKELAILEEQLTQLQVEKEKAIREVQNRWAQMVNQETQTPLEVNKKDIFLDNFGIAWLPYYLFQTERGTQEVPAFRPA